MAKRVQVAVDEQERLIDGLLTLARGERGIDRFENVDLADVAVRAIDASLHAGRLTELRVTRKLDSAQVRGDPELLDRMAINLVDNALIHNIRGGWVDVRTSASAGRAMFHVANGGPPIPAAVIPALFEPFRRHGADRTGARRGNGLGLSIVSAIATAHGGEVLAEPGISGGLDVKVTLPRLIVEVAAPEDP
jgi:signal transduction histidine kinase